MGGSAHYLSFHGNGAAECCTPPHGATMLNLSPNNKLHFPLAERGCSLSLFEKFGGGQVVRTWASCGGVIPSSTTAHCQFTADNMYIQRMKHTSLNQHNARATVGSTCRGFPRISLHRAFWSSLGVCSQLSMFFAPSATLRRFLSSIAG